jgi:hypothetical protein
MYRERTYTGKEEEEMGPKRERMRRTKRYLRNKKMKHFKKHASAVVAPLRDTRASANLV